MTKLDTISSLTHEALETENINHGFFKRRGGISKGIYAGLNCGPGSDDNPKHIQENRKRVAHSLNCTEGNLLSLYQIHSADVITLTEQPDITKWQGMERPKADGFVTNIPKLALGILTADCGPILFADPINRVIGACHAGWSGAFKGVMENTVSAMEKLGANRTHISAVLGPCIHQHSYEVGAEFVARFTEQDAENTRYFKDSKRDGHALFNLPAFIIDKLNHLDLGAVHQIEQDTYPHENDFFSFRRTTHLKEADYGRQISAISITE